MASVSLTTAGGVYAKPWDQCKDSVGFGPCKGVDTSTHLRSAIKTAPFDIFKGQGYGHYERIIEANPQAGEYIYIHPVIDLNKRLFEVIAKIMVPMDGLVFDLELYGVSEDCPQGAAPNSVDESKTETLGTIDMNPDPQDVCADAFVLHLLPSELESLAKIHETMGLRLKVVSPPTDGWSKADDCSEDVGCWGLEMRFLFVDPCFQEEIITNDDCVACFDPRAHFGRPAIIGPNPSLPWQ